MHEETTTDSREQAAAVRVYLSKQLWEKLDDIVARILRIEVSLMGINEALQKLQNPVPGSLPRNLKTLLDSEQTAHYLHINKVTVQRWARLGLIPAIKLPGGRGKFRFKSDDVEEFVNSRLSGRKLSRRLMKSL